MSKVYENDAFQVRVNLAAGYISKGRNRSRTFDTCFEMHDGDAVATALVRRVDRNPHTRLAQNIWRYLSEKRARGAASQLVGKSLKEASCEMRKVAEEEYAQWGRFIR